MGIGGRNAAYSPINKRSMRQIFVVYETDAWHSTSHRDCAGVFTSKWAAVNAIVMNHRIELDEFFSEEEIEKTSNGYLKPR